MTSPQHYARLLKFMRPYWLQFGVAILSMILAAATEPLFPALMKPLLDSSFSPAGSEYPIWMYPLAIVGIFMCRGAFGFIASYGMSWISSNLILDVREKLFDRMVRLPTTYFENQSSARLASRLTFDVGGISSGITTVLTVAIKDSFTVLALAGWLLYLNWRLTLIIVMIFPVIAWVVRFAGKRMRQLGHQQQEATGRFIHVINEVVAGQKVVKIFGGEAFESTRFHAASQQLRGSGMRVTVANETLSAVVQLLAAVAVAVVVYMALHQASEARTTVGGFVSFITALLMLLGPIKRLTDVSAIYQRSMAAADSVFTLLDEATEEDRGVRLSGRLSGRIEFRSVGFQYPGAVRDALKEINLTLEAGKTVALVGTSGGGKTTIANLIPRFHRPTRGEIFFDGCRADEIALSDLRRNIALVSQDVVLFNDSVANNIAYGEMRRASLEEIQSAARAAYAYDFIMQLPAGFDTLIGENGIQLSGGQRQRIAIARAMLKNAPILLLDEATSALDMESERQVQAAIEKLMQNRTTLVIAHRLSTVERADLIVVVQGGRVIEQGSHSVLLEHGGAYAKLYGMEFLEVKPDCDVGI
jgi:subfamily B ATP-binding cassette protein MsbA